MKCLERPRNLNPWKIFSERNIKTLKSNNGVEYTSNGFGNFCKDYEIKRKLTTPYNPQYNGVTKRKNQTIMEVVKTMIHDQSIPMHSWLKQQGQQYMLRIEYPIVHLGSKLLKKCSQERNQRQVNSRYLVVQCLFIFKKRKEPSWILPKRKEYLLDTMR